MKIGIISTIGNTYHWAGSEEMWYGLAEFALSKNDKVILNAPEKIAKSKKTEKLKDKRLIVNERNELNPITRRLAIKGYFSRFNRFFKHGPDVICLSMGGISDIFWIPDLRNSISKFEKPYIVIVQANAEGIVQSEIERSYLREFYAKAKKVIFVSNHNLKLAQRQLAFSFSNATIIANPLRYRIKEILKWPSKNKMYQMAMVARFDVTDKYNDHLIEALSSKEWKNRDWILTFYGSGPDEEHIKRLIKFYDMEDKIFIGGFVDSFIEIWEDHHIHILPSRREGMPLSLIESMACGRPAIVTRMGGATELIEDEVNGFISSGMHPEVLADTIEKAWAKRNDWKAMGMAAAEKVKNIVSEDWPQKIYSYLQEGFIK